MIIITDVNEPGGAVDARHAPRGYRAEAADAGCLGCDLRDRDEYRHCPHMLPDDGHIGCCVTDRPDGQSVIFVKAAAGGAAGRPPAEGRGDLANAAGSPAGRAAFEARRTLRRGGGLYVGIRLEFPVRVLFEDGTVRREWRISLGLLAWQLVLKLRGRALRANGKDSE